MRNFIWMSVMAVVMMLVACGNDKKQGGEQDKEKTVTPPENVLSSKSSVEVDHSMVYGNICNMFGHFDNEVKSRFDLVDVPIGGADVFDLKKEDGKYLINAPEDMPLPEIYEGASLEFGKVDGQTVVACYAKDHTPLWTMVGFKDGDVYNQYRRQCFTYMMAGKYKDSEGNAVNIGTDGSVKGFGGVESGSYEFSTVFDYVAEICRMPDGEYYALSVSENGLDLMDTEVDEETSGERMSTGEVIESLEYDGDHDYSWIHKHVLTSDYTMYVSSSARQKMIEMLKAVKSPSQTEAWNLFVLQAFMAEEMEE